MSLGVFSPLHFLKSLERLALNLCQNSLGKPSGSGLSFVGRFLITESISWLIFALSVWSLLATCSILANIPCAFEKNDYSEKYLKNEYPAMVEERTIEMSNVLCGLKILFIFSIHLLIFYLFYQYWERDIKMSDYNFWFFSFLLFFLFLCNIFWSFVIKNINA